MQKNKIVKILGIALSIMMLTACGNQEEKPIAVEEDLNSSIGYSIETDEADDYDLPDYIAESDEIYNTQEEDEAARRVIEQVSENAVSENAAATGTVSENVVEDIQEDQQEDHKLEESDLKIVPGYSEEDVITPETDNYNNYYDYEEAGTSSTRAKAEYYEVDDNGDEFAVTITGNPEIVDFDSDVYYTRIVNRGLGYSFTTEDTDAAYEIQNLITGVEFSKANLDKTPVFDSSCAIHFYSSDDVATSLTVYSGKLIKYKGTWYYAEDGEVDTGSLENICENHKSDELTEG